LAACGIGRVKADKILEERKNGEFIDRDDFKRRTKLKRTWSAAFTFPETITSETIATTNTTTTNNKMDVDTSD